MCGFFAAVLVMIFWVIDWQVCGVDWHGSALHFSAAFFESEAFIYARFSAAEQSRLRMLPSLKWVKNVAPARMAYAIRGRHNIFGVSLI